MPSVKCASTSIVKYARTRDVTAEVKGCHGGTSQWDVTGGGGKETRALYNASGVPFVGGEQVGLVSLGYLDLICRRGTRHTGPGQDMVGHTWGDPLW